jgi:hypothetical protein
MNSGTGKHGQLLAALGGVGLAISLWLPWYTIHIPQAALDSVNQLSQQLGALGPLMRTGAQLISQLGPFHVTAWQAFKTTPDVLLVAAIIGGGLALLALSERAGNTSQLTMLAGAVGTILVGYRIAVPPGQNSSLVSPDWGVYVGLLSSLALLAGGFLSGRSADSAEPFVMAPRPAPYPAVPAPTSWDAAAALSVAADPIVVAADPIVAAADPAVTAPADAWSTGSSVPPPPR